MAQGIAEARGYVLGADGEALLRQDGDSDVTTLAAMLEALGWERLDLVLRVEGQTTVDCQSPPAPRARPAA